MYIGRGSRRIGIDGRGFPNVGTLSLHELSYDGVNVGIMNLMFTPGSQVRNFA